MQWRQKYKEIKDFLLGLWSKEFLVFLFFVVISMSFWFMSTLNDTYETDVAVELKLDGVPTNVVITEELPDSFKLTLRDKGFNLLRYFVYDKLQPLHLSFSHYSGKKGHGIITAADLQKLMRQRVSETTKIVNVKADHFDFYYTYGEHRKLPIIINGQIKAKPDYYIMRTTITPDSVDVYASEESFDTVKAIYTEPIMLDGLTESMSKKVGLLHVYGAKFNKFDVANLSVIVDRLTEVTVSVPIKAVNVPNDVQIKTFPARVDVRVSVAVSNTGVVKPESFNVVVDYAELPQGNQSRFPLKLVSQPKGIIKAYLKVSEVDYVIEHIR